MEEQRAVQAGPAEDPLGLANRAHISLELQELGLLEFAEEVHFNRISGTPGDIGLPTSARHPGGTSGPVGHNNPPPQPTLPVDIQHCQLTNQAADMATNRACQVLHLSKVSLAQLMSSYNPRAAGSGGTDNSSKRRKTSRGADAGGSRSGSKGLRHFSMKVCEKVEAKGRTTYNEVADELVAEMSKMEAATKNGQYDEKNIRRRVYDAINVLMAMDIIQKEKKEITWKGFPQLGNHSLEKLKGDRLARIREVEQKQLYLQDMIEQQKALKQLLERSATRGTNPGGTQLFLPFILVQAKPDATVEVKISEDMLDVQFDFYDSPFQIHDDSHVLKRMAEHQARQQQQQQQQQHPFGNLSAGGLGLQWQAPNGSAGNLLAAALSPITDPAAALAVAAAQAQAQGSALAYGYAPAAAAAALYQQQQQLLHHHHQHQQQHPGQQQAGGQQQQQQQHPASQTGQQQQQQQGQVQQQTQQQGQTQPQQQTTTQQGVQAGQLGAAAAPQLGQNTHLQPQQLQTLQVLQAQLQQQQQLQAQLHLQHQAAAAAAAAARGQMPPAGLTLAAVIATPLGQQMQVQMPTGGQVPPQQGQAHFPQAGLGPSASAPNGQPQHPAQLPPGAPQLGQLTGTPGGQSVAAAAVSAASGPGPGAGAAGGGGPLVTAPALAAGLLGGAGPLGLGVGHAGVSQLPPLSHAPQLGALLPLTHVPAAMAAALAPTQQQQQQALVAQQPAAAPASGSTPSSSIGQLPAGVQPSGQHGIQLAGPAAATAFPLVA